MASEKQLRSLKEEATCSICLEYFTEPVSVECGHVFCLACITQCWQNLQTDFPCPQCRETSQNKILRPVRELANVVEIAKGLHSPQVTSQKENLCSEHEEKLKLFCEDDRKPLCVICRESRGHKAHTVLPIQEAAQEYKGMFQSFVENMKKNLQNILQRQGKEETKVAKLENKFKRQREQVTSVFEKVQEFLKKEEQRHLRNLEEKEKTLQTLREKVTKLAEQQALIGSQIAEIELKCQQPDVELLKDVKSLLSRFEPLNVQDPDFGSFKANEKNTEEEDEKEKGDEDLQREIIESLEWRWASSFAGEVILDRDTANPILYISKDGKSVRAEDRSQNLQSTPQRFILYPIVLGRERLTSGNFYWEVGVENKTAWDLGICDESVSRKTKLSLSPKNGFWTVVLRGGEYKACANPPTLLMPCSPPKVIGLFLDYDAGRLSVYNVLDRSVLFTFSGATFPRILRPIFSPGIKDGEKNSAALHIRSLEHCRP